MIFDWSRDNTQKKIPIFMNIKLQQTHKEKNYDFSQLFIEYGIGKQKN